MSDLQLSLLALGAVIIAAVILFNWWQERRFLQESMNRFEEPSNDILMADDFHIDPDRIPVFDNEAIHVEERFDHRIPEDALLEELHPQPSEEIPALEKAAYRPEPAPTAPVVPPREPLQRPAAQPAVSAALNEEPPLAFSPFEDEEEGMPAPAVPATEPVAPPPPPPRMETPQPRPKATQPPPEATPPQVDIPQPQARPEPPKEPASEPEASAGTVVSSMPEEVDEQIDLIGKAALPAMLDIAAFVGAVQQMPRFDKPVQWLLQDETGFWQPLSAHLPSGRYPQFVAALQLADRSGPVAQGTLLAFQEQVQRLASALGARLAWHGSLDPLQYAIELDQFCIDVDVMVGFHVLQGNLGPVAGTKLRGLAESNGLRLREDGAFHFEDEDGRTLYILVSQDHRPFKPETLRTVFYRGVSFQLDVPKVSSSSDAFNRMVKFARSLESSVDGILVDDNQRALGELEIEKIRQQLKTIHSRMVARFILPGSPSALRLFS